MYGEKRIKSCANAEPESAIVVAARLGVFAPGWHGDIVEGRAVRAWFNGRPADPNEWELAAERVLAAFAIRFPTGAHGRAYLALSSPAIDCAREGGPLSRACPEIVHGGGALAGICRGALQTSLADTPKLPTMSHQSSRAVSLKRTGCPVGGFHDHARGGRCGGAPAAHQRGRCRRAAELGRSR